MKVKPGAQSDTPAHFRTIAELAVATRKCYRSVHRAVQAGKIKSVRFGASRLIPPDEWDRVIKHGWR